ncbi:M14 family zinc carboxypeptidase [Pararhodonellum marinum]|uniref:M14 family zinc carboxypeptidase n=1 Tax=Pararhodonellum marinum TaxID=2755358 RepID=UPI00188F589D|nr:M14 family zinc carboxypeptidase [Pararhodonellum marinum]
MNKHLICSTPFYLSIFAFLLFVSCGPEKSQPKEKPADRELLDQAYESFQEPAITHRRFKHVDIKPLIEGRKALFQIEELGKSVEGREIFQLTHGEGPVKVLLWSQMHGNESTATMALFDLFNFLEGEADAFDELRNLIREALTLKFIPMVNPDGAEVFERRNAYGIDLNRDAIREVSPEAVILKKAREDFGADFGFNLHDQQIYYNAERSPEPATISVLAPAYNFETEVNEVRKAAMQVIIGMNELLQEVVPGKVGKYDDAFEPRAFGDNFQKWGTSTILIESGGYPDDPEKQYIRKLNFMIILHALQEIALGSYVDHDLSDYYSIPDNNTKLMDLILKSVQIEREGQTFQVDLGIKRRESESEEGYAVSGALDDVGDLSVFYGYEEMDASKLRVKEGKVYDKTFPNATAISPEEAFEILKEGYLAVKVQEGKAGDLHELPLVILKERENIPYGVKPGSPANFFLAEGETMKYAVVNGYLIDLNNTETKLWKNRVY